MEASTSFKLNIDLKDIPFDKYQKDFTFIVDGKEYPTVRFLADILSPYVRNFHYVDESINEINLTTNEKCDFNDILSLLSFNEIQISKEKLSCFSTIFKLLGNKDVYLKLMPNCEEKTTCSNVFDQISFKQNYLSEINNPMKDEENEFMIEIIQSEIDFIASHFYEIDLEKLKNLNKSVIEAVINNSKLLILDEDSLLNFILDLYSADSKMSFLFDYVDFLNVSNEGLHNFHQKFDLNDINGSIWNRMIERALNATIQKDINNLHTCLKSFPHNQNDEFNGIINYLTKKTGGNIHDNGTIEVSTNYLNSIYPPENLLDFNKNSFYMANGRDDAWVCFDFKNLSVKLTNYSIRSYNDGPNKYHLKNWVIEVSNDGKNWEEIDNRKDCSDLNGKYLVGTFNVKSSNFSRYVRLKQTGELWGEGQMWFHYRPFWKKKMFSENYRFFQKKLLFWKTKIFPKKKFFPKKNFFPKNPSFFQKKNFSKKVMTIPYK